MEKKDLKDLSNFLATKSFKYGESKIVFVGSFKGKIGNTLQLFLTTDFLILTGDAIVILEPEKLVVEKVEPEIVSLPLRFDFSNNQYAQYFSYLSSPLVVSKLLLRSMINIFNALRSM